MINECYINMMSAENMNFVLDYLEEEESVIERVFSKYIKEIDTVVCVGAGPLLYYKAVSFHKKKYIAVDPNINEWVGESKYCDFKPLALCFYDFNRGSHVSSHESVMYVLPFNIISHLDNYYEDLSKNVREGDFVVAAFWSRNKPAELLYEEYVGKVMSGFEDKRYRNKIYMNEFDYNKINKSTVLEESKNKYSDILVMRVKGVDND